MDRFWSVPIVWFFCGPTAGTRRNLQHRRSHARTLRMRSRRGVRIPRNPEGSQQRNSRPADIFTTAAVPERSAALDVCVWPPLMQQQLEATRRRRHLIANCPTTEMKPRICVTRAFTVPLDSGWATTPGTRTLQHDANRCRRNRFKAAGKAKSRLLFFAGEQP